MNNDAKIKAAVTAALKVGTTEIHLERIGDETASCVYWVGLVGGGHADVIIPFAGNIEVHDRRWT